MANLANLAKGHGWNSTWTPEREAILRELWADGMPQWAIAKSLNLTQRAIGRQGQKLGLPARENKAQFLSAVIWTDEQIERLTVLWAENQSLSGIGAELGFGHKTVALQARKLGLPERPPQPHRGGRKPKPPEERKARIRIKIRPSPSPAEIVPVLCLDGRSTILDLRANQCRYAIGERDGQHIFCGDPSFGSWCPTHRNIVFRRPE
jgi:hypothetical protein